MIYNNTLKHQYNEKKIKEMNKTNTKQLIQIQNNPTAQQSKFKTIQIQKKTNT